MSQVPPDNEATPTLRRRAEESLTTSDAVLLQSLDVETARAALYELRIHEIELHLQAEELQVSRRDAEYARDRYLALYNLAPLSYLTLHRTGAVVEANLTSTLLLGVSHAALLQSSLPQFIHPSSLTTFHALLHQLFFTGEPQSEEMLLKRPGLPNLWVQLQARFAASDQGEVCAHCMLIDISERKAAELEARRYLERLEAAHSALESATHLLTTKVEELEIETLRAEAAGKAKTDFLSTMSHELRTPLNGILGMTSLLLESPLMPDQRGYLQTIHSSGQSLLAILNDILDLAKVEAGKLELDRAPFNLHSALEDIVEIFSARAREKGLHLFLSYDSATPRDFVGDAGRIRQILLNLISNAIKFTDQGHVLIEVSGRPQPEVQMLLRISVIDTGIGIASSHQQLLFQKFQQVDSSNTRRFGGTGLGLFISRRLVDLMGGEIHVASEVGLGSNFSFTLTLPPCPPPGNTKLIQSPLIGRRVAITSIHPLSLLVLAELSRRLGMLVTELPYSHDILTITKLDDFDFIFLDEVGQQLSAALNSPTTSGRTPTHSAHIVSFSSQPQLRNLPCDAYILKPFREDYLVLELQRLLGFEDTKSLPRPNKPSVHGSSPTRVLLVEDNVVNQRVALALLGHLGCEVTLAQNGKQACELAAKTSYDLILMDCMMPVMDGYQAVRTIRQMPQSTPRSPIVALTANAMPSDRDLCMDAGMDDVLTKPISKQSLQAILKRWTARD